MNSGRRASSKTPPKTTPPAADRTVAETVDRRLNELRPAERRAAGTLLADYPGAGLGTVADLPSEPGLARHWVMRFAQGLGYDGFTAVPSDAAGGADAAVEGAAGTCPLGHRARIEF